MGTSPNYECRKKNYNPNVACPCCCKEMRRDNIEAHMLRKLLKEDIPAVQKDLIRRRLPKQRHRTVICHKCQKETSFKHLRRHLRACMSLKGEYDEVEMEPKLKRGRPCSSSKKACSQLSKCLENSGQECIESIK